MEIQMSHTYPLALLLAALTPLVAEAQKDVASCKPVLDASAKMLATPYHAYSSTTESQPGSKPQLAEVISTGGVSYVLVSGQWHKSPLTPAAALQLQQENVGSATAYSCKRLREESVVGVAAIVYGSHMENEDVKADSQIWVAKGTGLVLRTDTDMETTHVAQRVEYTNVQPPAGVK
jgi:hypothetical protein